MNWLMFVIVFVAGAFALVVLFTNRSGEHDNTSMIGLEGIAGETFSADGMIHIRGELWRATTERGIIEKGSAVRVVAMRPGLILVVEKTKPDLGVI